jgi:hypothetical protein
MHMQDVKLHHDLIECIGTLKKYHSQLEENNVTSDMKAQLISSQSQGGRSMTYRGYAML